MSSRDPDLPDPVGEHRQQLIEAVDRARVDLAGDLNLAAGWLGSAIAVVERDNPDISSFNSDIIAFETWRSRCGNALLRWEAARKALASFNDVEAVLGAPPALPDSLPFEARPSVDREGRLSEIDRRMVEAADVAAATYSAFAAELADVVHPPGGEPAWSVDATEAARLLTAASNASLTLHDRLREREEVAGCTGSA